MSETSYLRAKKTDRGYADLKEDFIKNLSHPHTGTIIGLTNKLGTKHNTHM